MSASKPTVTWVCDRCEKQSIQFVGRTPLQWWGADRKYLGGTNTVYHYDLCGECDSAFLGFLGEAVSDDAR